MGLLHLYFDFVTVATHTIPGVQCTILNWTGWTPVIKIPRANMYHADSEIYFTKKEVETFQKLPQKNGDVDFVDEAKFDYHGHLSYMMHGVCDI